MLLYQLVNSRYKGDELYLLADGLGHDIENLPARRTSVKAQRLVEKLAAQRRLMELFHKLEEEHPREPLAEYFYELIVERFFTDPTELEDLLDSLELDSRDLSERKEITEDAAKWLRDTARRLQREMAETGRWSELLGAYAAFDNEVEPDLLERLFALDRGHQASPADRAKRDEKDEFAELFLPFLQLNYHDQVDSFDECDLAEISAFVIYGLPDGLSQQISLRLLLKKLLNRLPENIARINMTPSTSAVNDADGLWNEVARSVGIDTNTLEFPVSESDQDNIISAVHSKVTAGQYVLIVEQITDQFAGDLLKNFWEPFTRKLHVLQQKEAREAPASPSSNGDLALSKVLLFLVDTMGLLQEDTVANANLEQFAPIELPRVAPFKSGDLRGWKRIAFDHPHSDERLKSFMRARHWDQTMIDPPVGDGQGVKPEIALRYMCKKCQYDYGGKFIEWLKGESKSEN